MRLTRRELDTVEMQMGPMIDMVFLLLVFFMVTAKPIKPEADVGMRLPGTVAQEETIDLPDEQRIEIRADGSVELNGMVLGGPQDQELRELVRVLTRFREASEANNADALITLVADPDTIHQRIIDVMNACAVAGISGVTFASDSSDQEDF